jgi:transcriptional regulator with XRE-family HTH domain
MLEVGRIFEISESRHAVALGILRCFDVLGERRCLDCRHCVGGAKRPEDHRAARDSAVPRVGRFLLIAFRKQSAMAITAATKASNPTDRHIGARVRMRRKMLEMSQTQLADALGITYQQVQKNESGTNRIGASRLQQISHILQVPVAFFFEGGANVSAPRGVHGSALSIAQIDDFVASSEGLRLIEAFMRVHNADLRRKIVMLVQEITGDDGNWKPKRTGAVHQFATQARCNKPIGRRVERR